MFRSALVLSAVAMACCPAADAFAQSFAGWHSSLERAAKVSAESGKPLFVVFRCER